MPAQTHKKPSIKWSLAHSPLEVVDILRECERNLSIGMRELLEGSVLSETQMAVALLLYQAEMEASECACALGVTEKTVETHRMRALKKIRNFVNSGVSPK
jgi:DNA-directed RNA polymerase specialized sigma24 family protein